VRRDSCRIGNTVSIAHRRPKWVEKQSLNGRVVYDYNKQDQDLAEAAE
jgi:hypothetical protein